MVLADRSQLVTLAPTAAGVATAPPIHPAPGGHTLRERPLRGVGRMLPGRLVQAVLTVLASSIVVWLLSSLAPGDPAQQVLSSRGVRTPTREQLAAVHHELGLDQSLVIRYWHWLTDALHGDLGTSYISDLPVRSELAHRLGATLTLAGTALVMVVLVAVVVGLGAAAMRGRWPDVALRTLTVVAAAVPAFIVGLVIIQVVIVGWGIGEVIADGSLRDALLPAVCIAVGSMAVPTRVLRAGVIDAVGENYALMARARGGRPLWVLLRHGLPNAIVPFIHALSLTAAYLIGGTVVVEAVFTWPGVGSYLVSSVQQRDLPVIQAGVLLATLAYVLSSLLADVLTALIDPRTDGAA